MLKNKTLYQTSSAAAERTTLEDESTRWDTEIRRLVGRLRTDTGLGTTSILRALLDIPYASILRYLAARSEVPADLADVTATAVRSPEIRNHFE